MSEQSKATLSGAPSLDVENKELKKYNPALLSATENSSVGLKSEVLQVPDAYTVNLVSSTDWPVVIATALIGLGSVLTTSLVGWYAYMAQRNQVKANAATYRNEWRTDLRGKVSDYISKIAMLHYKIERNKAYLNTPDSDAEYSEVLKVQAAIGLMLNERDEEDQKLSDLMGECDSILKYGSKKDLTAKLNEIADKANKVLDNAWQKMKQDIGLKVSEA